jgi:hypothetical protein
MIMELKIGCESFCDDALPKPPKLAVIERRRKALFSAVSTIGAHHR